MNIYAFCKWNFVINGLCEWFFLQKPENSISYGLFTSLMTKLYYICLKSYKGLVVLVRILRFAKGNDHFSAASETNSPDWLESDPSIIHGYLLEQGKVHTVTWWIFWTKLRIIQRLSHHYEDYFVHSSNWR